MCMRCVWTELFKLWQNHSNTSCVFVECTVKGMCFSGYLWRINDFCPSSSNLFLSELNDILGLFKM